MSENSTHGFTIHSDKGLRILKSGFFDSIPWLAHGFSTRGGGQSEFPPHSLNLGFIGRDTRAAVESNRRSFFEALHLSGFAVARLRQTHSDHVVTIESGEQLREIIPGDAVITRIAGVVLTVLVADCVPILIADLESHTIAAIHAGWRGTSKHITLKAIDVIREQTKTGAGRLYAVIGPSIRACCYEVGVELLEAFESENPGAKRYFSPVAPTAVETGESSGSSKKARFHLDLLAANRAEIISAGIPPENISIHPDCTRCHPELYFSHRGESGQTGRMMAAIAMK